MNYYVRGGGDKTFSGFDTERAKLRVPAIRSNLFDPHRPGQLRDALAGRLETEFGQSDGSVGTSRNIFLSQIVDPYGNAVTLTYDGNLRLVAITDAIGQVTTLAYGNTNDLYKITQVTDPFGRFATFSYDALGRLTNITDVIGMNSQFAYQTNGDFINALTTSYGTTTFISGDNGNTRALDTIYPDGSRDRVEYNQGAPGIAMSDPAGSVPQGMNTLDTYLVYRNTFYWSRNACAIGVRRLHQGKIYHWLHDTDETSASGILESTKERWRAGSGMTTRAKDPRLSSGPATNPSTWAACSTTARPSFTPTPMTGSAI